MTLADRLAREAFAGCGHVCVARWLPGGADFEPGLCPACFAQAVREALREAATALDAYAEEMEREDRTVYPTGTCVQATALREGARRVRALGEEARRS